VQHESHSTCQWLNASCGTYIPRILVPNIRNNVNELHTAAPEVFFLSSSAKPNDCEKV
jgi:hypothetical protein